MCRGLSRSWTVQGLGGFVAPASFRSLSRRPAKLGPEICCSKRVVLREPGYHDRTLRVPFRKKTCPSALPTLGRALWRLKNLSAHRGEHV